MRVAAKTETVSYLDVATRQLNRSIRLYLDEKDYLSSITLAGAAEEILGQLVVENGGTHELEHEITATLRFCDKDENDPKERKSVALLANYFKNRTKHYRKEGELIYLTDLSAAQLIDRAISNYWTLTQSGTEDMEQFKNEVLLGNT
ncbi:MAG: hypothetical protein COA96_08045 [SAR86 cluster bacterium]|uniref:Uncharacterized protein n=1 Tax=SAR86 cluster bacterium TaxID=2030880 RepID=A0A2A5B1Z0_9GAMM|nr:MAG: hypothetical protein COA96_08045 [SAR86 cluster bacterium]